MATTDARTATGDDPRVGSVYDGFISFAHAADSGFGYDPVFLVGDRTYAEMSDEEKNHISHRALAIRALADALADQSTA